MSCVSEEREEEKEEEEKEEEEEEKEEERDAAPKSKNPTQRCGEKHQVASIYIYISVCRCIHPAYMHIFMKVLCYTTVYHTIQYIHICILMYNTIS